MEEPESRLPLPSPQPSREIIETSWGLDVTPERQLKPRERIRKFGKTKQGDRHTAKTEDLDIVEELPVSVLSLPKLNSTAQLQNRIHQLKQLNKNHKIIHHDPSPFGISDKKLPTSSHLSAIKENVADLEGILNQKPLKEVNVPRHINRYSDLTPVDVSEESFHKLITKPKKKEKAIKMGVKSGQETTQDTLEEPSIMDLFSTDLEWEEAEWTVNDRQYCGQSDYSQPVDVPRDASYTLYTHTQHTLY